MTYAAAQGNSAATRFGIMVSPFTGAVTVTSLPGFTLDLGQVAAAGVFRDTKTIQRVEKADWMWLLTQPVGSGTGTVPVGIMAEYVFDSGGSPIGTTPIATVAASTTSYLGPFGLNRVALQTTVAAATGVIPFAATLKNFCGDLSGTQSSNNSLVLSANVNAVNVISLTFPASRVAGILCDYTTTVALSANDLFAFELKNNANATSATITSLTAEILPTSGTPGMIGGGLAGTAPSGTQFWIPFDSSANATELNAGIGVPRAGTATTLCVYLTTTGAGASVFTLFKNGSPTSLVLTLSTAAGAQCVTGSVAYAQGDTMSLKSVVTGSVPWGSWVVDF